MHKYFTTTGIWKITLVIILAFSTIFTKAEPINTADNIIAKHIGPAIGGAMFAIAIDPNNKNNIFFSGDMGVVYHTINGGDTWDIVPGMNRIRSIKFDPNNTNIIWAVGSTGVYKSIDGGSNWNYSFQTYRAFNYTLGAIAIDPTDSNIIYVAEGFVPYLRLTHIRGRVFKSTDGGATWISLARPGGANPSQDSIYNRNYSTIIIDPNSTYTPGEGHSDVYLMGRDGLFKTENAGSSWNNITFFDEGQGSDLILINDNNQSILFSSVIPINNHAKKGIYKSIDNGITWQESNSGLDTIINALYIRNHDIRNNAQFSLMLAHSASDKNKIYVGSWQGIAKSTNQGQTWTQTTPAETPYIQHNSGAYVQVPLNNHPNQTETFLGGIDNFIKMTTSDSDSNFVIFGDNQDIHFSTDGGVTWKSRTFDYTTSFVNPTDVFPGLPNGSPKNRYTHKIKSRGVQGLVNTDVAVDPFNSNIYYATYMDVGLEISRDGGETWEHPSQGIPPRGHAWSVVVDPNNNGVVWVSIGWNGKIYKSTDHGVSWSDVGIDVSSTGKVTDMIFDAQSNTLYASSETKGIFKTTNNGQSWQNIFTNGTFDIKIDLANNNILYAGTKTGLYKSINGGSSWTQLASDKMGKVYNISVGTNNTIYVISNKAGEYSSWNNRDLWVSSNQGVSFSNITPSFMHKIGGVAVTPNNPQHLYISASEGNQRYIDERIIMAQSWDGGLTWENLVNNFAFALGSDIYINPNDSQHVFFNTQFSLIEVKNSTLQANAGPDINHTVTASNSAVHLVGTAIDPNNNIVKYEWFNGTTFIGTGASRWYVLTEDGTHTLTLKVTDANGNVASDTMVVNVNHQGATQTGTLTANAGPDINHTVTASNQQIHLNGILTVGSSPIVKQEWFKDGVKVWTGSSAWYTLVTPGDYNFEFRVTAEDGSVASDTMVVTVVTVTP